MFLFSTYRIRRHEVRRALPGAHLSEIPNPILNRATSCPSNASWFKNFAHHEEHGEHEGKDRFRKDDNYRSKLVLLGTIVLLYIMMDRRSFCKKLGTGVLVGSLGMVPMSLLHGSQSYTVRRGDTLSGIASAHGITVTALRAENGLQGDLIRVGQVLTIPGDNYLDRVRAVTEPMKGGLRTWRYIVAHHSAVPRGNAESYGNHHLRRGMTNGLAYHFVIGNGNGSGDGEIEIGPRWFRQQQGGHVRSQEVNHRGIGICLVGNFEETRPTQRQMAAFTALVGYLRDFVPTSTRFAVHREIDGRNHTLCPGRFFPTARMHQLFPDQW